MENLGVPLEGLAGTHQVEILAEFTTQTAEFKAVVIAVGLTPLKAEDIRILLAVCLVQAQEVVVVVMGPLAQIILKVVHTEVQMVGEAQTQTAVIEITSMVAGSSKGREMDGKHDLLKSSSHV